MSSDNINSDYLTFSHKKQYYYCFSNINEKEIYHTSDINYLSNLLIKNKNCLECINYYSCGQQKLIMKLKVSDIYDTDQLNILNFIIEDFIDFIKLKFKIIAPIETKNIIIGFKKEKKYYDIILIFPFYYEMNFYDVEVSIVQQYIINKLGLIAEFNIFDNDIMRPKAINIINSIDTNIYSPVYRINILTSYNIIITADKLKDVIYLNFEHIIIKTKIINCIIQVTDLSDYKPYLLRFKNNKIAVLKIPGFLVDFNKIKKMILN